MSDTPDSVTNRSEIVFLYDAVDANPNGNPLSGANRPRIDPQTQQAIVTDVRLKRYLRDQLDDDGHGVYIRNVQEDGTHAGSSSKIDSRLSSPTTTTSMTTRKSTSSARTCSASS